jgi:hypothetical protein
MSRLEEGGRGEGRKSFVSKWINITRPDFKVKKQIDSPVSFL